MVKSIIKQDFILKEKEVSDLDKLLDEAILETEKTFNKSLKQLSPKSEAKDFLYNLVESFIVEDKKIKKYNINAIIEKFLNSNKKFSECIEEEVDSAGLTANIGGREELPTKTLDVVTNYRHETDPNLDQNEDESNIASS